MVTVQSHYQHLDSMILAALFDLVLYDIDFKESHIVNILFRYARFSKASSFIQPRLLGHLSIVWNY